MRRATYDGVEGHMVDIGLRVDPLGASDGLQVRERQRAGAGGCSRALRGVKMEESSYCGGGYVVRGVGGPCAVVARWGASDEGSCSLEREARTPWVEGGCKSERVMWGCLCGCGGGHTGGAGP